MTKSSNKTLEDLGWERTFPDSDNDWVNVDRHINIDFPYIDIDVYSEGKTKPGYLTFEEFEALCHIVKKITDSAVDPSTSDTTPPSDPVSHPSHYTDGNIEVIEYIKDKGLLEGFCKGNVIKYVSRAGKKASTSLDTLAKEIQDLEKARWYLDYLINYYKDQLF